MNIASPIAFQDGAMALNWVRTRLAHDSPATLAVAFWGAGAVDRLGLAERKPGAGVVRVICNLALGGTNPHEIRKLMALPGISVEQSDRLHGKVFLFMMPQ